MGEGTEVSAARRLADWPQQFGAFLAAERERPWRVRDHCLLFCARDVAAITGDDLAAAFDQGRFRSMAGAKRHLRALGFTDAAALISSVLPERPPAFARRGDLVLGADGVPGVCIGPKAAFKGPDGLVTTRRGEWVRAWSVGEI